MSKFKYFTYIIGAILLFSSFDVQKCADALQKAYEEKNYDAFVDAFPDKYGDFVNVYGYDFDNWQKKILYDDANEHISFLFSTDRVLESKVLDKLLSLSYNYVCIIAKTKCAKSENETSKTSLFSLPFFSVRLMSA